MRMAPSMLARAATLSTDAFTSAEHARGARRARRGAADDPRARAAHGASPLATVHRVVVRLVEWGGLERVPGGVRPGLRLFELGQLVPQRARLSELALPFMGDLYAVTHEVVSLAILDGTDTVWVEQLVGTARSAGSLARRRAGCRRT